MREGNQITLAGRSSDGQSLTLTGHARHLAALAANLSVATAADDDTELEFAIRSQLEVNRRHD